MSADEGSPIPLLVATTNRGKLAELGPLLEPLGFALRGLDSCPDVPVAPEDEPDFVGNAKAKALHYARATGLDCVADDSGLCVDALDGAPGVHSARYAGPDATDADNVAKLLGALDGVDDRAAAFVCCIAYVRGGEVALTTEGACPGTLTGAPRGEGGFGYDPLFVPDEGDGRTFAEMTRDEKKALSHRGRAVAALVAALTQSTSPGPAP